MEKHIKVARAHRGLSWIYGLFALLFLVVYLFTSGNTPDFGFIFVGIVFAGLFVLHHFTAKGAFGKKDWARYTSQGIALLMLFGFPVGTFIGIYLLANSWGGWEGQS